MITNHQPLPEISTDEARIRLLAQEVWVFTFHLLDAEIDYTGMEAGRIATETEQAFLRSNGVK